MHGLLVLPAESPKGAGTGARRRFGAWRPRALCLQERCSQRLGPEKRREQKQAAGQRLALGGRGGCPGEGVTFGFVFSMVKIQALAACWCWGGRGL